VHRGWAWRYRTFRNPFSHMPPHFQDDRSPTHAAEIQTGRFHVCRRQSLSANSFRYPAAIPQTQSRQNRSQGEHRHRLYADPCARPPVLRRTVWVLFLGQKVFLLNEVVKFASAFLCPCNRAVHGSFLFSIVLIHMGAIIKANENV